MAVGCSCKPHFLRILLCRSKTTSAQYVSSRARDPTFEKLMRHYKNLMKVVAVQDLILASPQLSVSVPLLSRLSQRLHLNRGPVSFLRKYPHIFALFYDNTTNTLSCRLTPTASLVSAEESFASSSSIPFAVNRLSCLLSISSSKSLPLRAVFRIWRELGLPDDFEDSVIAQNPTLFALFPSSLEPNTHLLKLVRNPFPYRPPIAAVETWRQQMFLNSSSSSSNSSALEESELQSGFKHSYPPGMKLSKQFRARVREWQKLPYVGPYDEIGRRSSSFSSSMGGTNRAMEKRVVGIVHEFLSLTVEKMVELEKISHFRKWFGINLNIRDLFLDHPGIFYLSTKGKRHTIFLREAYDRGCLIEPNPIYDARRKLLDLVILGRRGIVSSGGHTRGALETEEEDELQEVNDDDDNDVN